MKLSGDYDLKSWSSGTKVTNRKYSEEQVGIESLTIKKGRQNDMVVEMQSFGGQTYLN